MPMEIWATGSNAFGQLKLQKIKLGGNDAPITEMEDYTFFRKILSCEDVEAIYTGEYGVHVRTDIDNHIGGPQDGLLQILSEFYKGTVETKGGAEPMTWAQKFYGLDPSKDRVMRVALSGTKILVGTNGVQVQLENLSLTAGMNRLPNCIDLPDLPLHSKTEQIVAGETHFAALYEGEVYTWGDERYPATLGRSVTISEPASRPTIVSGLEDLPNGQKVVKIAANGYITAALTNGGDCYFWGRSEHWCSRPEPVDYNVVDVAVGGDFAAIIIQQPTGNVKRGVDRFHSQRRRVVEKLAERELWVKGRSQHGELGLDDITEVEEWTKVEVGLPGDKEMKMVVAGAMCVFLVGAPGPPKEACSYQTRAED